jgi:putative intracellular protease/amidase
VQIAFLLFDCFTALDVVGPYDVLSHLPGAEVTLVAERPGPVVNEVGSLRLIAGAALADVPRPDVVVVPGGPGQNAHMHDGPVRRWLLAADAHSTWTASVCSGSLLLAAAGLLNGRRATSHWLCHDQLARSAPSRCGHASSSTASTSPPPASPPAWTWRSSRWPG